MKKILLIAVSFGLTVLFSCKKESEQKKESKLNTIQTDSVQTTDKVVGEEVVNEVVMPTLESQEATDFANKYNDYVIELKSAAGSNPEKLSELTFRAVDLEKEFLKVQENLSEEDNKKLTKFVNSLKESVQ